MEPTKDHAAQGLEKESKESSTSVPGTDGKKEDETVHVEDEPFDEPNAAEEWLVTGVADRKACSEVASSALPLSTADSPDGDAGPPPSQTSEPGLSSKEQLRTHLLDLQHATSWGSVEEAQKARRRILAMSSEFPEEELERKMEHHEARGNQCRHVETLFKSLIKEKGVFGTKTVEFWKSLPRSDKQWFVYRAKKMIRNELISQLGWRIRKYGPADGKTEKFISKAESLYGKLAADLRGHLEAQSGELPVVEPGVEHRISQLKPEFFWTLYIDETGARFGDEKGKEGRIVGLLFPKNTRMQPLPRDFHAVVESPAKVLTLLNELLDTPCGILGLGVDDLHKMTREHWLASVLEVVHWVWRLLPLPENGTQEPVTLDVLIENKGTYDATKDLEWLRTGLVIAWDKESLIRNRSIRLGRLDFVPKGTGLIGWVDLVAYCWGASKREIKEGMKQGRLIGSCLLTGVRDLLPIWAKAIRGELIEAHEWQLLMEQKDAAQKGSLTCLALENLKTACRRTPEYSQRYVDAMNAYLATKEYDLSVVETQADWLAGMEGVHMGPEMRFFTSMALLTRYNHTGEIFIQAFRRAKNEVSDLAETVGLVLPHARCHAMLRLAVTDANAFDFKAAEERLAPWNPEAGGALMGSAIWDGKVLSSLGQYAAFQGRPEEALPRFDHALARFKLLEQIDAVEASRQHSQTATYAAIAAMDAEGLSPDERRKRVEGALRTSVLDAAGRWGGDASPGNRYLHHLLVRYLVMYGSAEERDAYCRKSSTWLLPGVGAGAGHPWPLIQYYRWELTKDRALLESIFSYCWGREQGATVKLIGIALGIAGGTLPPRNGTVSGILEDLKAEMPKARVQIDLLLQPGGLSGLELLKRVLPFNYR